MMIAIDEFIKSQLDQWPQAAANYQALGNVVSKEVVDPVAGKEKPWRLCVQFNPARIVSTGAKVDAATLKKRPCFLCEANRPAVQTGIQWGDYTILINPFPIFPKHLTVPANQHVEQSIKGRVGDMYRLALELPEYVVFYNGQHCGASAPDHMHFQAGNRDFLPMIEQIGEVHYVRDGIGYPLREDLMPGVMVIDAQSAAEAEEKFDQAIHLLPVPDGDNEPMINVLAYSHNGGVRLLIIPRKKHRPSCYGSEEGQMLVSPASVDLAGVMITPLQKDFDAIDYAAIKGIIEEVCYTSQEIKTLLDSI